MTRPFMPATSFRVAIRLALLTALAATIAAIVSNSCADESPAESTAPADSADQSADDEKPAKVKPPKTSAEAPQSPPVAPEKIAGWILQLDDDHFSVRENAQQQLAAAGAAALASVGNAAAGGSLESSTRAVNILLDWSRSPDAELSLGALEHLAALKNRPAESALAADRLADVREVAAIKAIADLGGRVVNDQQMVAFNGAAPSLQIVIGPQWTGGLEGLSQLEAVRRASTVSFHSSTLGEKIVGAFPTMENLQRIELYGVQLPPEALESLKKRAPNAMVEVRGPARLGIAGMHTIMGAPNPAQPGGAAGALVKDVLPASAAAKAGILPGDVITEFAGTAVEDFPHLTREIAKCQAGEQVQLKVLRQAPPGQPAQTLDVTVVFDRWGEETTTPAPGQPDGPAPAGIGPLGMPRGRIIINQQQ